MTKQELTSNVYAGLVVGIVSLPLAMAFAIASGVKPEQGIYTAIIAGLIVSLFGGTRTQISGPTGAFVVILASITAKYGVEGLQVASIMAGAMLWLMGFLKIGNSIRLVPYPVVIGFTSGIAIIIFVGQWKNFFGLPAIALPDASFWQNTTILLSDLHNLNRPTTALALFSLGLVAFSYRIIKGIPSSLVAILVATIFQSYFDFANIATIGSIFGEIPQSMPSFKVPSLEHINLVSLLGPAVTIALLGAIESLLSATAADSVSGGKHNPNQELAGQGLANLITPFFGGFASTGAIARTITNVRSGGTCFISGVVHSFFLLATLLIFAPYAKNIPLCSLAAILFLVTYNMADFPEFGNVLKHAPWYDVSTMLLTFFLTILTDLVVAFSIGFIAASLLFVIRVHQTNGNKKQSLQNLFSGKCHIIKTKCAEEGMVYSLDGPFFFGICEQVEHVLAATHTEPRFVVLHMGHVPFIDLSGLSTLSKIITSYNKRHIKVYICKANKTLLRKMQKTDILNGIEDSRIFGSTNEVEEHYCRANIN